MLIALDAYALLCYSLHGERHMVPMVKKIHVCWFGGEMPDMVRHNIDCWKRLNPDFEICLYNEHNFNFQDYEFAQRAIKEKRWGFLVDIVRPLALFNEGGWYLDADIELVRPLSSLEKYGDKLVMGYMYTCALGTAALYAPAGHPFLADLLGKYHHIKKNFWPVSNSIFTEYFINHVPDFLLTGKEWENECCKIFPKEFFEQPSFLRRRGMAIHHCCGSWKHLKGGSFTMKGTTGVLSHLDKWARRKVTTWKAARRNEFTACHQAALKGIKLPFDASSYYE